VTEDYGRNWNERNAGRRLMIGGSGGSRAASDGPSWRKETEGGHGSAKNMNSRIDVENKTTGLANEGREMSEVANSMEEGHGNQSRDNVKGGLEGKGFLNVDTEGATRGKELVTNAVVQVDDVEKKRKKYKKVERVQKNGGKVPKGIEEKNGKVMIWI
jgi:hypothetical protein